jgi:hypothetical protein
MEVFSYLHIDNCEADLARCARVHSTWTHPANDTLWQGHPGTVCQTNSTITKALALLPRKRRQYYAFRVSVLDFSTTGGFFMHSMFDKIQFPRLKDLILNNVDGAEQIKHCQLSKYFLPNLEKLTLMNGLLSSRGLTRVLLEDIARRCPNLKSISVSIRTDTEISSAGLARFFELLRPCDVLLRFEDDNKFLQCKQSLTYDVFAALSGGGRLETLILECDDKDNDQDSHSFWYLDGLVLERLSESITNPFPRLRLVKFGVAAKYIPWAVKCFRSVTTLRIEINHERDCFPLRYIAELSQLEVLEISSGSGRLSAIPGRDFTALGSLFRLSTLHIGNCFFPDATFTAKDSQAMFSGLASLESLTINMGHECFPVWILSAISRFCPRLDSIEFDGSFPLWLFLQLEAPLFENVKTMTVGSFGVGTSASKDVRLVDNIAPALETLQCASDEPYSNEVCAAFSEYRHPKHHKEAVKSVRSSSGLANSNFIWP